MGYRSTNKTVYSAKYHIVWCPKLRCRVLAGRVEVWLMQIIAQVVDEVIEVELMADHVQLLAEAATMALSRLVQPLKGRWSRMLGSEFPALRCAGALWSPWWLVSTVGGAPIEGVRRYVDNQKVAG